LRSPFCWRSRHARRGQQLRHRCRSSSSGGGNHRAGNEGRRRGAPGRSSCIRPHAALVHRSTQQGSAWIDAQIQTPATGYPSLAVVSPNVAIGCPSTLPAGKHLVCATNTVRSRSGACFSECLSGPDQLRQRVALAYSQSSCLYRFRSRRPTRCAVPADAADTLSVNSGRSCTARHAQSGVGAYLNMATTTRAIRQGHLAQRELCTRSDATVLDRRSTSSIRTARSCCKRWRRCRPTIRTRSRVSPTLLTGWTYRRRRSGGQAQQPSISSVR